jgi:hypothetical protein
VKLRPVVRRDGFHPLPLGPQQTNRARQRQGARNGVGEVWSRHSN